MMRENVATAAFYSTFVSSSRKAYMRSRLGKCVRRGEIACVRSAAFTGEKQQIGGIIFGIYTCDFTCTFVHVYLGFEALQG